MTIDPKSLPRFLELAQAGQHAGASSGEKIANRLAKALADIGDDVCLLDAHSIDGACMLLQMMAGPWKTDDEKARVYHALRKAAGV